MKSSSPIPMRIQPAVKDRGDLEFPTRVASIEARDISSALDFTRADKEFGCAAEHNAGTDEPSA